MTDKNKTLFDDLPELDYPPDVDYLVRREGSFTQEADALYAVYEAQAPAQFRVFVRRARRDVVALIATLEKEADALADIILDQDEEQG